MTRRASFAPSPRPALLAAAFLAAFAFAATATPSAQAAQAAEQSPLAGTAQVFNPAFNGFLSCAGGTASDAQAIAAALENNRAPAAENRSIARSAANCGKAALRATSGQLLLTTMQDAVQQAGISLFDANFRLDSSLSWVWGEQLQGELDVIVPLWHNASNAFFLQPGAAFWPGIEGENRTDANLGIAYRRALGESIAGLALFYDHDFQRGHRRASLGADIQSGAIHAGLNYYHPLTDWREGRNRRYEEQALRGVDARIGLASGRLLLEGTLGYWRFEGERDESSRWRASYAADVGYRVLPGVFLEGGYEHHDDASLDSRWHTGLAFRFSLPGFEGVGGADAGSAPAPDLWKPVQREKRILYEERLATIDASLSLSDASGAPIAAAVSEGDSITLTLTFSSPLPGGALLPISFTTAGADANAAADIALAEPASGSTPAEMNMVAIPAGATTAEVMLTISDDTTAESVETVTIALDVPPALADSLDPIPPVDVIILPNDENVAYLSTAGAATPLNREVAAVAEGSTQTLYVVLGNPAPMGGLALTVTASDADDSASADVTIADSGSVTVPAGAQEAEIEVTIVAEDNTEAEGEEEVTISIATSASGWSVAGDSGNAITLAIIANNNTIAFDTATGDTSTISSRSASGSIVLDLENPAPSGGLTVSVASDNPRITVPATVEASEGESTLSIPLTNTAMTDVGTDGLEVTITVSAGSGGLPAGWDFGDTDSITHTLTLRDQGITFTADMTEVNEPASGSTDVTFTLTPVQAIPAEGITITATPDTTASNAATEGSGNDYTLGSSGTESVTFAANATAAQTFTLSVNADTTTEADETITINLISTDLPSDWSLAPASHTITIPANDNTASFATSSATTATEGTDTSVTVTVQLSNPAPNGGVPLSLAISGDTTSDPAVSVSPSGAFTIAEGEETHAIAVTINEDTDSDSETITFTLTGGTGFPTAWGSAPSSVTHTLTIADDEVPTVTFASNSPTSVTEGGTAASFSVVSSSDTIPSNFAVTVAAREADCTTAITSGITITTSPLNFSSAPFQSFTVAVADDSDAEADEMVCLHLSSSNLPSNWQIAPATHTFTIPANDNVIGFTDASADMVGENGGTAMVSVETTNAPAEDISLVITATGTATNATDYTLSTTIVTIPAGMTTSNAITVTGVNDEETDAAETIILTISDAHPQGTMLPTGWAIDAIGRQRHTITITDDDAPPATIGFAASQPTQVTNGVNQATMFTVSTSATITAAFQINVAAQRGSCSTATEIAHSATLTGTPLDFSSSASSDTFGATHVAPSLSAEVTVCLRLSEGNDFPASGWNIDPATHEVVIQVP